MQPRIVRPLAIRDPQFFARAGAKWIAYVMLDCEREAAWLGLPIRWPSPDPVDQDLTTGVVVRDQPLAVWLARLGVAGVEVAGEHAWAFLDVVSRLIWSGLPDWHQPDRLGAALAGLGINLSELEASILANSSILDSTLLENEAAQASAGHSGVPLMVLEGEPFFGQDRLDALARRLDGPKRAAKPPPVLMHGGHSAKAGLLQ